MLAKLESANPTGSMKDRMAVAVIAGAEERGDLARRLAREEAIFTGTSSGASVVAALRVAQRLGPDATVVTL